jgi:glycerol-3-phosphate dehydrogenase
MLEANTDAAPLLSVWGGKITTFRKLAEEAGDAIVAMLGERRPAWSRGASLPGGDLSGWIGRPTRPDRDFARFVEQLRRRYPWLAPGLVQRLARAYGSRVELLLGAVGSAADLGREAAPGLFEAELDYLRREEWAIAAADVLWRRSKLGLHYSAGQRASVENFLTATQRPAVDAAL